MFDAISRLFSQAPAAADLHNEPKLAVAALLVALSAVDGQVTDDERAAALRELAPQTRQDTEFAIDNVRRFAEAQLGTILPLEIETLPGVHLGHRVIPIERVGCYVPGGRYPLLSAPIMTIVPAKVADVDEVIACLPPNGTRR